MTIPEDVKAAAYEAMKTVDDLGALGVIASAILAERQRCADVAQREAAEFKLNGCRQEAYGAIVTRKAILA
ncbi:hypothetical protein IB276_26405 [Ensifer sp. ENS04]|uniref:hypothetical protein n=1 Tax=Ensifer sp. ENS04 TaxID=2769281 RepID=UPI00177F8F91|nr:hypothetical protein [Ensifer sp. ENS04]MBD9542982.1 hypothetical protein [Ensifer sp. ENS04]